MKSFNDEVRSVIESNPNPPYDKAQALRLYVEKSDMDALVAKDMEKYRAALAATGGVFGGVEPVSRFHEAFQGPIDAAYAAAVVGLETDTFLERVRENTGLQNVGLLALDNENGSVQRDTWTSSFRDVMYALDYPQQVEDSPVITQPDVLPGAHVLIPDPILRTMIAEKLGKSINAPITVEEMKRLGSLHAERRDIRDLTGIQFATNLTVLHLAHNQISDLTPIAGLINLKGVSFGDNPVSDISPVRGLKNLTWLELNRTQVSDLSPLAKLINLESLDFHLVPVTDLSPLAGLINLRSLNFDRVPVTDLTPLAGLINLKFLHFPNSIASSLSPIAGLVNLESLRFSDAQVSDLSPIAGLINLKFLHFNGANVSDISPIAGLTNLEHIHTWGNPFPDISALAGLTKLKRVNICGAELSDLSPLAGLTSLKELYLRGNGLSDVSPLAGLTGLDRLSVEDNNILDISPLAGLTNLKWLAVNNNEISDFSSLDALRVNTKLVWYGNPGFPEGGPKIEGPWLWVLLPDARLDSGTDLLAEVSSGRVTEEGVGTLGATEGKPVGDAVWTSHKLPPRGWNNISDMLGNEAPTGVIYGTLSLYSPHDQETTMFVGAEIGAKVWLNGALIHENRGRHGNDYGDFFPVTLRQGRNVLLVAVGTEFERWPGSNAFFGFEPSTEYTLGTGVGYVFSETPIHLGDTFTFDVRAENVVDMAGWQFDIVFDPFVLEALEVSEGVFLKSDAGTTFFQSGSIDNENGKITGLSAARLTKSGISGSGTVLQVRFKALFGGETTLALQRFQFGSVAGEDIPAGPHEIRITVEGKLPAGDVNRDGVVSILDLILIAQQLGQRVPPNSPVDVNRDGIINIFDLTLTAQGIASSPAAPSVATGHADTATIEAWITLAQLEDDSSIAFRQGIANLQNLLASPIIPQETALHANYPNPFNPETWIPYQLAAPSEVTLTIHDMSGTVVRRLEVGHQPAGLYQSRSRAAYWDGRNGRGESVASGLYFYTLTAGDFTATRKMLIKK